MNEVSNADIFDALQAVSEKLDRLDSYVHDRLDPKIKTAQADIRSLEDKADADASRD